MGLQYDNFKSLNDFYNAANAEYLPESVGDGSRVSRTKGEIDFFGTSDFEEAMTLARNGWSKGLEKLKTMSKAYVKKTSAAHLKTNTIDYDVAGAYPDVQRFLSGEPESMVRFSSDNKKFKSLKIIASFNQNYGVSTNYIFKRGAAILNLVDILEKNNIRCEVILSAYSTSGDNYIMNILAKRLEERLNLESLNFALCHGASYRRLGFSVRENRPLEQRRKQGCYGWGGYGKAKDISFELIKEPEMERVFKEFAKVSNINSGFSEKETIILSAFQFTLP